MADTQFQAFTWRAASIARDIVTEVAVSQAFDPENPPDNHQPARAFALWDTGASGSVISASLAKHLGLAPTGVVRMKHAGGVSDTLTYMVNLALPNSVGVAGVRVTEFPGSDRFAFIVGMDVITMGDFSITNLNARTLCSFRMPSRAVVDYVEEHNRAMKVTAFAGVERNHPCPCKSGKKFKHCHGR